MNTVYLLDEFLSGGKNQVILILNVLPMEMKWNFKSLLKEVLQDYR